MNIDIRRYDNLFRLPPNELEGFQRATNWINDTTMVPPDLYVVEPGLNYNNPFNGSLIFTLQDGLEVEIPAYELAGPLRGIDSNGQRVLNSNVTTVNIFDLKAPQNTATLGKVFLSQGSLSFLKIQKNCFLTKYSVIHNSRLSQTAVPARTRCPGE
jgi:hypothetical protein